MNQAIGGVKNRRKSALQRLENQLQSEGHFLRLYRETNPIEYEKQVKRIEKEISTLKSRI